MVPWSRNSAQLPSASPDALLVSPHLEDHGAFCWISFLLLSGCCSCHTKQILTFPTELFGAPHLIQGKGTDPLTALSALSSLAPRLVFHSTL